MIGPLATPAERQVTPFSEGRAAVRDAIALFVLAVELPIPLFWLLVHPAIGFWRRHPRACYYGIGVTVWVAVAAGLLGPRQWWLAERFSRHPLTAVTGALLIAVELWLIRQAEHSAGWRVLLGLPELYPGRHLKQVAAGGIYERLRHPRYLGMMLAWLGAALLSGATRLLVLVVGFMGLAVLVTELEERELLGRLGEAYADYRRRVPRFLPRRR